MYLMYLYAYFLIMVFVVTFFMSMNLFMVKVDLMIEWVLFSLNSSMVEFYILLDWVACLFVSFICLISSMVIIYSVIYMSGDKFLVRFFYLVLLFLISMILMILTPSLVSILFGWDMLGLVSYCLIIYYQNCSSYSSGMVTVLTNRIGDIGLLMAIGSMLMYGSWNMYMLEGGVFLGVMIMVSAITKSAQMPFSSWLPMAMAAPTPVSALVHSSTLVTAGVYLIIRFNKFIMLTSVNFILLFLSISTMMMSGIMANFEYDLKKVIALSTLSQLGLMMMILSLGFSMLSFYHLLVHAIFKSLLFLCAGIIIHSFMNNQDIRCYGNLNSMMPFMMLSFYISIMSLMGVPFMSGFYSKDLIIEMTYSMEMGMIYMSFILISLVLTIMYSLRLFYYLFFGRMKFMSSIIMAEESLGMNLSMMILMILSVVGGSMLNWIFFFEFEVIVMSVMMKNLILILLMFGMVWGCLIMNNKLSYFLWDNKNFYYFLVSMWFLNFFYKNLNKNLLFISSSVNEIDSKWVELVEVSFWLKLSNMFLGVFYYKHSMYMIFVGQVILLIMISLFVFI